MLLDAAGFQKMVYEDFYEVLTGMIQEIARPQSKETVVTPQIILNAFQNPECKYQHL